jgi:hypothetical protein
MCTGLELMGAGMGAQAFGAYQSSRATKAAHEAQAQVQRNNATVAGWQAEDAIERGNKAAMRVRSQARQLKGTQRARLAAAGVDLGEGSALQILSDTDYFGEVDAQTTVDNAAREAWAIRQQAAGYSADAALMQSRAAAESPLFAAGTSLLTSASRVAERWYTPAKPDPIGDFYRRGTRGSGD